MPNTHKFNCLGVYFSRVCVNFLWFLDRALYHRKRSQSAMDKVQCFSYISLAFASDWMTTSSSSLSAVHDLFRLQLSIWPSCWLVCCVFVFTIYFNTDRWPTATAIYWIVYKFLLNESYEERWDMEVERMRGRERKWKNQNTKRTHQRKLQRNKYYLLNTNNTISYFMHFRSHVFLFGEWHTQIKSQTNDLPLSLSLALSLFHIPYLHFVMFLH